MASSTDHVKKMSPRQLNTIVHIFQTRTYAEAARQSGIKERTLYKWLRDSDFQNALCEAKQNLYQTAMVKMQAQVSLACTALTDALQDQNCPHYVKIRAADSVLSNVFRFVEVEELRSRVESLEEIFADENTVFDPQIRKFSSGYTEQADAGRENNQDAARNTDDDEKTD